MKPFPSDIELIKAASAFSPLFYKKMYLSAADEHIDPFEHYIEVGHEQELQPHPLFNPKFYKKMNVDVADAGVSPLMHYLRDGGREWRSPSPLVDMDRCYELFHSSVSDTASHTVLEDLSTSKDRSAAFQWFRPAREDGKPFNAALMEFLDNGVFQMADPHPLIRLSTAIDDHSKLPSDLFAAFETLFTPEGDNDTPVHPLVEIWLYRQKYSEEFNCHPVIHYIKYAPVYGGSINSLFDYEFYNRSYKKQFDAVEAFIDFAEHATERQPNAFFDPKYYETRYSSQFEDGEFALQHYMRAGAEPWFNPSERFAQRYYIERYGPVHHPRTALGDFLFRRLAEPVRPLPPKPTFPTALSLSTDELVDDIHRLAPETPETPRVTVIVPVYGERDATLHCIHSLLSHNAKTQFLVEIVDDASPDELGAWLAEALNAHPTVSVWCNEINLGFLLSCQAAVERSTTPYVALLNNDTLVLDHWLDELVATLDAQECAGLVGSKLIYPNGTLQEAGGMIFVDGSACNVGNQDDPQKPDHNYRRPVDYVSAAAVMFRRFDWDAVGGFSEDLAPAYYEDTDLAMKLRAHGKSVLYQPKAAVVHFEGLSSGTDLAKGMKRYQVTNQQKFLARWHDPLKHNHPEPRNLSFHAITRFAKARVLVFDHDLPRPDRDSGSVTASLMMRTLVQLGYHVTALPENGDRPAIYAEDLERKGVRVLTRPYVRDAKEWLFQHAGLFDVIILSRAFVGGPLVRRLKALYPDVKVVFDTVDLHHLRLQRQIDLSGENGVRDAADRARSIEHEAALSADLTMLVSDYEAHYLETQIGAFPHLVLPLIYEHYEPKNGAAERTEIVFIGGFNHPPNLDAVDYLLTDIWPRFRERVPEATLTIIGSHPPQSLRNTPVEGVRIAGFVEKLEPVFERARMSVAPLRYGAGVKGKVGNSLRLGVPVVATPVAVEGMNLTDGRHLLVGTNADELVDGMVRLYQDNRLWHELAAAGWQQANALFGQDQAARSLKRMMDTLLHHG